MRSDLDSLMQERGIAGLVVFAQDRYSPAMYYVTGQKIHVGVYLRAADGRAHLVVDPMERDQGARVGCDLSTLAQHGWTQRVEREPRPARAWGELIADLLATLGLSGRVAFYGDLSAGFAWELLGTVSARAPGLTVDDSHPDLLSQARCTKDDDEMAAIRRASAGVVAAWSALRGHLEGLRREGNVLLHDGRPVTLGDLRKRLNREFLAHGLEGGESIVSQGRDAGVPHNRGNDAEPLRPGSPVIVDIFPGEAGGGYFSDFTRTFCVGAASEELRRIHADVHDAYREAMAGVRPGAPCRALQERTCDLFESRGHATRRTDPGLQEGYVHSLGHGVGLSVHEAPLLGGPASNTEILRPGMVVTVEPGLYYPSRGLGVRIEDLVVVGRDGCDVLTPAPCDLEIEPRG